MMEAGSYFLHLKEFVECMQNSETAHNPAGLILQAFSQSVNQFVGFYQQ